MDDKRSNQSEDEQPTLIGDPGRREQLTGITPPRTAAHPGDAPTLIDFGPDAPTMVGGSKVPRPSIYSGAKKAMACSRRTVLALRYEILQTLGVGGMRG